VPPFRYVQAVRFGDVDHARIVYYPRFFHYCHVAFEELFGAAGYRRLLDERMIGFPAVHVEFDFSSPLRFGDTIEVAITTDKLGRSSVTFAYEVTRVEDRQACARARVTVVAIDMRTFSPVEIPDDLRALFQGLDSR
jgi:4-hydroxybenzoyl-CoA thioesterase